MHGRLKVKTTAEQQEAKTKEREKKQLLFTGATKKLFKKRNENEFDQDALNLSGDLLSANPDFYTVWNIRRETLKFLTLEKSEAEVQSLHESELYFLEQCLRVNPKSYGSWHHRCWVLDNIGKPDWKRELQLCNKFLEYDERNFHCWDYRRFVVMRSNVESNAELGFTDKKINSNFSNFSSWHYRTKLLPKVHPDAENAVGVKENILQKEFELVQNAFFTDPSDQSAWFYHRWLLGRGQRKLVIDCVYVNRDLGKVIVTTSKPIKISCDSNIVLAINDEPLSVVWKPCSLTPYPCQVWMCIVKDSIISENCEISVSLGNAKRQVSLTENVDIAWNKDFVKPGTLFSLEMSASTTTVLTQELESCQQLAELEPDHKWTMLTIISLMKALDPLKYETEMLEYIGRLMLVDTYRKNYYNDLRSRIVIENTIETLDDANETVNLSGKQLTIFCRQEHLTLCTGIDLSNNQLSSVKEFNLMACLRELNLEKNCLVNTAGLEHLQLLEELNLKSNLIEDVCGLYSLMSCPRLKVLEVGGNPFCKLKDCVQQITTVIPNVKCTVLG